MKVFFTGVRKVEEPLFEKISKDYDFDLTLKSYAINMDNIDDVKGHDVFIGRMADKLTPQILDKLHEFGLKYVFTRTVGFDHIDVAYAKKLGLKLARVSSYSPTAISELAVSMALGLSRKANYFAFKAFQNADFSIDPAGFSKEIKNSVVAIMGTGKIGFEAAKMFKGLGARVVGYDPYPNEKAKEYLEYVSLDEALKTADIVSFHLPYIKNQNEHLINDELISKMKDGAILINCARGQIQDNEAILKALKSNKLYGAGLDVLDNEAKFFGKNLGSIEDPVVKELVSMYPRVLITPHIGSYTDEAASNMIQYSLDNLVEYLQTGDCKNKL